MIEKEEIKMNKLEEVKELVTLFKNTDNEVLFMALCLNEKIDYQEEIEDITKHDIIFVEKLYNDFIENDNITSFINSEIMEKLEIGE